MDVSTQPAELAVVVATTGLKRSTTNSAELRMATPTEGERWAFIGIS